jgi:hypothetical protein
MKYRVSSIDVDCNYIIILNLGIVPKKTENDLCRLLRNDEKEKLRYTRMWLKRMINQVIRGSFECYKNAEREITETDHVVEVNQNIANAEGSINMNLWALNEEMGFDSRIKEKIDVRRMKNLIPNEEKIENFIELPDVDHDAIVEKETMDHLKNEPDQDEMNIVVGDNDDEPIEIISNPIKVKVDTSSAAETDVEDREAESEEDDIILVGDGEGDDMMKYATEICIPQSNESEMITRGEIKELSFQQTRSLRTKSLTYDRPLGWPQGLILSATRLVMANHFYIYAIISKLYIFLEVSLIL